MQFEVKKYLNEPGSFYIYQVPGLAKVLSISNYRDRVVISEPGTLLKRFIATSIDERDWSAWQPINNVLTLPAYKYVYIKIMWKLEANPSYEFVDITDFSIDIEQEACNDNTSDFKQADSMFETLSKSLGSFEKEMNIWANDFAGLPVDYYRTLPDQDTKDVMLNEYSIHNVVECKRINLVAENLPDLVPDFNDYSAIAFEKFELFVDYEYFKLAFGKDAKPRQEDRIYLPIYNILYYVHSAYLSPGIRERSLTWVLSLLIHDESTNIKTSPELNNFKDMTLTKDDLFAEELLSEMNNAKQTDQVKKTKKTGLRLFTSNNVEFVTEDLRSNSHIVSTNHYTIKPGAETPTIRYKNIGKPKENLAICHLFRYRTNSIMIHDDGTNSVSIAGNVLYVRNQPGPTLSPDKWYGLVINFYGNNCEVNIWEFKSEFRSKEDTSMKLVSTQFLNVKKFYPGQIQLGAGEYDFANLRIWKMPVSLEYQSFVLTQAFVEKPDKCYLIDNCDPENRLWNYSQDITV